jgi:hypothetical protein
MKLDDILDAWDTDTEIDDSKLDRAALKQPKLHHKYLKMLSHEKLRLKQLMGDAATLRTEKYEFYTMGPTKETVEKGWEFPSRGKILNKDASMYMDGDKEIITMNLRVALQAEIVASLELIMKEINNRNWVIGRAIDFQKLMAGG